MFLSLGACYLYIPSHTQELCPFAVLPSVVSANDFAPKQIKFVQAATSIVTINAGSLCVVILATLAGQKFGKNDLVCVVKAYAV